MNNNSSKTTLKDLEIAIKFLNKEITVKDVEDIYGNFNDPKFQSALSEAKSLVENLTQSISLRNLVLLRSSLKSYYNYLGKIIQNTIVEISNNLAETQRIARNIKIASRYYKAELRGVEQAKKESAEFLKKAMSIELQKLTQEELRLFARDFKDVDMMMKLYEKRAASALKSAEKYRLKLNVLEKDLADKEALQVKLEEDVKLTNIKLTSVEKAIYANQLLTLSNVVSGLWEHVRDNIIY